VIFAYDSPVDTFWYGCQAMFYVGYGDSINNPTWPPLDPLTLTFYDVSLGGVQSWHWDFGDGTTSTDPNPSHTYADSGVYVVTLSIVTVGGCESQASYEICVGNNCWGIPEFDCQAMFIPLGDSIGGNGIQFIDLSFALDSIVAWTWNFGDGTSSNEQNPYHVYAQPGVYTVTLTIEGFLCNSQISFEVDTENPWNFSNNGDPAKLGVAAGSVATKEPFVFDGLKLFPNPAQTDVSIAFSSQQASEYELRISDLTGKVLSRNVQQANSGLNSARVNVANLLPGLYLAEIRSGDAIRSIKFVKQ
jgi:chitodextrinase